MDAIDGSVPVDQIQRAVERLRRDRPYPGILVTVGCLGDSTTVSEAARQPSLTGPEF